MSVTTTADEAVSEAKQNILDIIDLIENASTKLNIATNSSTWGHDEYKKSYFESLLNSNTKLLSIKTDFYKIHSEI